MKSEPFEVKVTKTFPVDSALVVKGASSIKGNSALVASFDVDLRMNTPTEDGSKVANWLNRNLSRETISEVLYFLNSMGHVLPKREKEE